MIVRRRRSDTEQYPRPSLGQKNSLKIHLLLLSRCLKNFGHLFWLLWSSKEFICLYNLAIYIHDNGPSMWLKRHNGLNIPPSFALVRPHKSHFRFEPMLSFVHNRNATHWCASALKVPSCLENVVFSPLRACASGGGWVQISRYVE